jgi:tRNA-splicing ligase RtcB
MKFIKGEDIMELGFKGPEIGLALKAANILSTQGQDYNKIKYQLIQIIKKPEQYVDRLELSDLAKYFIQKQKIANDLLNTKLRDKGVPLQIYGKELIEEGALHQMYLACKLPIAYKGALMPDGHSGYGISIGGVLATENAVIPYGVGVDIGCRMSLTIYPMRDIAKFQSELIAAIEKHTFFGAGGERIKFAEHEVIERDIFNSTSLLRGLKEKAARQLGTSGSGNHFVEFGIVEFEQDDLLPKGQYLGLMAHSGSRGLGAKIAAYYTDKAKKARKLDPSVSNLAWLMMDEEMGMEYWEAMNLAGDYAKANHDIIHQYIAKEIVDTPLIKIENHHNFAWKENHDGKDLIVHRKGATPAGNGVLGVIPGSMSTVGYVVRGKGLKASLDSASHGAGRLMSRSKAKQTFNWSKEKAALKDKEIHLIGAGVDECSSVYKDIEQVMAVQSDLVEKVAKFTPKIVRMAGADEEPED